MGHPEKDPKINVNPSDAVDPAPKGEAPPKLDAILPDDLPPAAAELVGDIESYQKRMEREWEKAKSSYEDKINRIMEDFLRAGVAGLADQEPPISRDPAADKTSKPFSSHSSSDAFRKRDGSRETRLAQLMAEMERELKEAARKSKPFPFVFHDKPEVLQLPWQGEAAKRWLDPRKLAVGALLIFTSAFFYSHHMAVGVAPLPYAHTLGPIVWENKIYIVDWFRKALYVHKNASKLPILSVEPLLNNLLTGVAFSEKTIWTLDSLDRKILLHAVTPDHQLVKSISAPGTKPAGLFYDGSDLWSADQSARTLYRHHGNDLEDIKDEFPLPELTVTSIAFHKNRFWILDGKSRLVNVYRLQKPLLQLGSFDLDPFVKGATPTGMTFLGTKLLVVTENPPTLTRIPLFRLKKSKTETF